MGNFSAFPTASGFNSRCGTRCEDQRERKINFVISFRNGQTMDIPVEVDEKQNQKWWKREAHESSAKGVLEMNMRQLSSFTSCITRRRRWRQRDQRR